MKTNHRYLAIGRAVFLMTAILSMTLAACGGGSGGSGSFAAAEKPIPCSALTELGGRLAWQLKSFTNKRTGDSVDYLVIGDAAMSDDVIVMFNGTGEIVPDWPLR